MARKFGINWGRFHLRFSWWVDEKRAKRARLEYGGIICDVCGQNVKGGNKAIHLHQDHPEYKFHSGHATEDASSLTYWCDTCGQTCGGDKRDVRHYKEYHPEEILKGR